VGLFTVYIVKSSHASAAEPVVTHDIVNKIVAHCTILLLDCVMVRAALVTFTVSSGLPRRFVALFFHSTVQHDLTKAIASPTTTILGLTSCICSKIIPIATFGKVAHSVWSKMCEFTYITYSECAHTALSTKPEHTSLCSHARLINLLQGVDCAPADCVPTDDTETRIAANYVIFDHCDDCRAVARAAKPIKRGELDDIIQLYAHAKEEDQGFYDEDETEQLRNLATYLGEKHIIGLAIVEQLRTLTSNMSALALIADPELRDLLCAGDVDRHFTTFKYCSELFPLLGSYIQQGAPNKVFVETFTYLRDKAKKATALLECFQIVVDCLLNYEPSQPEEHFNGGEARLEFFGDMLKHMITGRGLGIPSIAYDFHEDSLRSPKRLSSNSRRTKTCRKLVWTNQQSALRIQYFGRSVVC
jgi:hypothetical protein